jgi:hypothetical protein
MRKKKYGVARAIGYFERCRRDGGWRGERICTLLSGDWQFS